VSASPSVLVSRDNWQVHIAVCHFRGKRGRAGKIAHVTHSKFDLPDRADMQQTVFEALL
jgi:hypothetical protein